MNSYFVVMLGVRVMGISSKKKINGRKADHILSIDEKVTVFTTRKLANEAIRRTLNHCKGYGESEGTAMKVVQCKVVENTHD